MQNQGFVMNILKIKLEQPGQLIINKQMCASAFFVNLKKYYHENLDTKNTT